MKLMHEVTKRLQIPAAYPRNIDQFQQESAHALIHKGHEAQRCAAYAEKTLNAFRKELFKAKMDDPAAFQSAVLNPILQRQMQGVPLDYTLAVHRALTGLFGSTIQYFPHSTTIYFCRDGFYLFIFYSHLCRSVSYVFLYLYLIFYFHLCSGFNKQSTSSTTTLNPETFHVKFGRSCCSCYMHSTRPCIATSPLCRMESHSG